MRARLVAILCAATLAAGCAAPAPRPHVEVPVRVPCTHADCLRVLTWNVHGIPFIAPRPMARLRNVAALIRAEQPDVVLLQELWAHTYAQYVARLLVGEYRLTTARGCGRPFPCGGLAVLVRVASGWTASGPTFVPFRASGPWYRLKEWDFIAKKGMLMVNLARGEQTLGVVNVHLQTGYARHGRSYSKVRRRQLEQLARTLDGTFGTRAVLLGGDLNIAPIEKSGLYASHVARLGDDRTTAFRERCTCGTRTGGLRPRWIDYLITRRLEATATLERLPNDAIDDPYSDHDGLLLRLTYDPATMR